MQSSQKGTLTITSEEQATQRHHEASLIKRLLAWKEPSWHTLPLKSHLLPLSPLVTSVCWRKYIRMLASSSWNKTFSLFISGGFKYLLIFIHKAVLPVYSGKLGLWIISHFHYPSPQGRSCLQMPTHLWRLRRLSSLTRAIHKHII